MKRFTFYFISLPLAIILVLFALANRQTTTLNFDILFQTPSYSIELPLFVTVLAAIIFGAIIGGIYTWFGQHRYRVEARRNRKDAEKWHQEVSNQENVLTPN